MLCRNCDAEMERVDHCEPTDVLGKGTECLHAIYSCPTCQREVIWRRHSNRMEVLFPGVGAPELGGMVYALKRASQTR